MCRLSGRRCLREEVSETSLREEVSQGGGVRDLALADLALAASRTDGF